MESQSLGKFDKEGYFVATPGANPKYCGRLIKGPTHSTCQLKVCTVEHESPETCLTTEDIGTLIKESSRLDGGSREG